MTDIADLRELLGPLDQSEDARECRRCHSSILLYDAPDGLAPLCDGCAQDIAVNVLPAILDELEALRAERDRLRDSLAERTDGYRQMQRAWDEATDILTAWRTATGCDSPEEVTSVAETLDAVAADAHAAELARLRKLEAAALDLDAVHAEPMHEGMDWQAMGERRRVARARMSAAIAACRAAICTGVLCEDALTPEGLCSSCNRPRAVAGKL